MTRTNSSRRTLLVAIVAAFLTSCATIDTVQPGAGGKTFQVTGKSYDQVWTAVNSAAESQLSIVESDRKAGVVRAESKIGLVTWGEVVGIFVRPTTPRASAYTVEVQSLKRARMQVTGTDWTDTLIRDIKAELNSR